jgi:hypothetical protein
MLQRTVFTATIAALFVSLALSAGGASTLTYDVSLDGITSSGSPVTGSGVFTVNAPTAGYSGNESLLSAVFVIGGATFTLQNASSDGGGFFYNPITKTEVLDNFYFTGANGVDQLTVGINSYVFTDNAVPSGYKSDSFGTASVSVTPLPSTLWLFAGVLAIAALCWFGFPRKRAATSPAATMAT